MPGPALVCLVLTEASRPPQIFNLSFAPARRLTRDTVASVAQTATATPWRGQPWPGTKQALRPAAAGTMPLSFGIYSSIRLLGRLLAA